jgi:hypothetical protein
MDPFFLGVLISILLAFWVYDDAKEKNLGPGFWAFGTFLLALIVFPLYFYERSKVNNVPQ